MLPFSDLKCFSDFLDYFFNSENFADTYEGRFKSTITLFTKPVKKDKSFKTTFIGFSRNFLLFYIITMLIEALIVTQN